jgi:hypothetical protein
MVCLAKDPDKRPASAGDLAARLSALELPSPRTKARARLWWGEHLTEAGEDVRPQTTPLGPAVSMLRRQPAPGRDPHSRRWPESDPKTKRDGTTAGVQSLARDREVPDRPTFPALGFRSPRSPNRFSPAPPAGSREGHRIHQEPRDPASADRHSTFSSADEVWP